MRNDTNNNNNMTKDTLESSFVLEFFIRERETSHIFRVSKKEVHFLSFLFCRSGEKTLSTRRETHNYVWILPGVLLLL